MSIPGYDAWKLRTPPEYEWENAEDEQAAWGCCPCCDGDLIDPMQTGDGLICASCWEHLHRDELQRFT